MINLINIAKKTTEIEKKGKKIIKKMKVYAVIIGIIGAITFSGFCFYSVSKWYDENKVIFQSPIIIKIQTPVRIEKRAKQVKKAILMPVEAKITPERVKTEFEIVQAQKHGNILWNIYQLETQRGKTDSCRIKGQGFGGFGVMNEGEVICYPTFDKAVERAEFWWDKLDKENTLDNNLCIWNTGISQPMCNYSILYHKL